MGTEGVALTREELYEMVWSDPIRTLAKRLWISDVALAKRCRKLRIPLPGVGYWAKKAAGHRVRRVPLTDLPASAQLHAAMLEFRPATAEPITTSAELEEQRAFEADPANHVLAKETLRAAHPLVRKTAEALRRDGKSATTWARAAAGCLDVRVTGAQVERSLRLMDALVRAFEHRGWSVVATETYPWQSYVVVLGQRVAFGLREPVRKVENEPAKAVRSSYDGSWYTPHQSKYRDEPSGRLSLVIRSRHGTGNAVEESWNDRPGKPVEERLNDFVLGVFANAERARDWDLRREENARLRQQQEALRVEEARRRQVDADRRRALEEEVGRWVLAEQLRAYLKSLRSSRGSGVETEAEWLTWASAHADRLDPTTDRLKELAGDGKIA